MQKIDDIKLLTNLRCCKILLCLVRRETLPEGVMPKWITKVVNWAISG